MWCISLIRKLPDSALVDKGSTGEASESDFQS